MQLANPQLPSGIYLIDADSNPATPPLPMYCDMDTAGGGFTLVFLGEQTPYNSQSIPYDAGGLGLMQSGTEVLIAFRDDTRAVVGSWGAFDVPPMWRVVTPFSVQAQDEMVFISVDDAPRVPAQLRYGNRFAGQGCSTAWAPPFFQGTGGRVCVEQTQAPNFSGFAAASDDFCAASTESTSLTPCSASRMFSIAVRHGTPSPLPASCKALKAEFPSAPSGRYSLDLDANETTPPASVYCDLQLDGGGWTLVFEPSTSEYNTANLGYSSVTPELMDGATEALIVYRSSTNMAVSSRARFDLPSNWRSRAPFTYGAVDETLPVSINGAAPEMRTLRYGSLNWGETCASAWGHNPGYWGRVCIEGTDAPFYAGFANFHRDSCSGSHQVWNTAWCTDNKRFTIGVR